MKILVINSGSSTYKCNLYDLQKDSLDTQKSLWEGLLDYKQADSHAALHIESKGKKWEKKITSTSSPQELVLELIKTAFEGESAVIQGPNTIDIIGHRVVHGGEKFLEPILINSEVKKTIRELSEIAPLHNPLNLQGIEIMEEILPGIPQAAIFDTSFHSHMPEAAYTYPGPYAWKEEGIRRYGFHGISHQYCSERVSQLLDLDIHTLKIITCHLGNGCSLAAVQGGKCIDTTMGFTPLEGLMMGTRSGSVDPGILLYLLNKNTSPIDLDRILNYESGLKGISGTSSDMRLILENRAKNDSRASLAFDIFIHRLKSCIGAMASSLGGLDVLVFTAGIGENASAVRAEACKDLKFLGISLDDQKNESCRPDADISSPDSKVKTFVIHTRENFMIAKICFNLLNSFNKGI